MRSSTNKQHGLALITVLFIFALVSLLAVSMQKRQVASMAQAGTTFSRTQAMLLAISAEDIAKAFLKLDANRDANDGEWDTAVELWNQPFTTVLSGAEVFINIRDLQGLFNLNTLAPEISIDNAEIARARFERLLSSLTLPSDASAATIAAEAKDWFDSNSASSSHYQNLTPPYSSSNSAFSHPSELMLLESVDRETYLAIEPYVTALPFKTQLNVNTTHEHILQAWDANLILGDAKTTVDVVRAGSCGLEVRAGHVFEKVEDFLNHESIKDLADKTKNPDGHWETEELTVSSQYFSVFTQIKIKSDSGNTELILESIIKRDMDDKFIGVVYRDFSRKLKDISDRLKIVRCQ
jgi:general secretion pathway protein K